MITNYLALLCSVALSLDAAWGFTSTTTATIAFQRIAPVAPPKTAFLATSVKSVLLFSDVSGSSEEVAVEESTLSEEVAVEESASSDGDEAPKTGPSRKRHTLFVGNLPFGE